MMITGKRKKEPVAAEGGAMTTLDLDPIRARLAAATPGPWDHNTAAELIQTEKGDAIVVPAWFGEDLPRWDDAELIAHAPADIAALVAEVERLRERLADVKALHRPVDLWEVDPVSRAWLYDENDVRVKVGQLCSACTPDDTLEDVGDRQWSEDSDSTFWPCQTVLAARGEAR